MDYNDYMRKRIGVLLAQLEENTQKRFMQAFTKEAYAHDYDICIFSMFQKYQETQLRNIGDSNIYSLIQYDSFDGLVIMLDTILTPGFEDRLLARIKNSFDGPVIVVDKKTDMFDYVLMDHYSPIVELTNHLIDVHGYRDIAFLGGKEGHPHSLQRLNGFLDSMAAHNLPVRDDRIYHGNFWFDSGKAFAAKLLEHADDLPEAVLCANDYMAIGLATELTEKGYRIPDHIAVVGYDSNEEGRTSPVPLTSADIPAASCGKICFGRLHEMITDEHIEQPEMRAEILIGGSCGCKKFAPAYTKINRDNWKTDHSERSYYSDFNHITEDMLCQTNYRKFYETLAKYSYQIRPFNNFWICLNRSFLDPISFIGDNARRYGYDKIMNMVIKCGTSLPEDDPETVDLNRTFETRYMIPALFEDRPDPTTFIFVPMFFEDRCFGYAVLNRDPKSDIYNETFRVWMRNVNQGIEAFYRQKALLQMIEEVRSEQIRDKQTGLYNYDGFHKKLSDLASHNIGTGKSLGIIAFDIEDLRGINEDLSHNAGDSAISAVSLFISQATLEDEYCGRLGNDEFLIGFVNEDCRRRYDEIIASIPKEGIPFYDQDRKQHRAFVYHEICTCELNSVPDLDFLINRAVNVKNHSKKASQQPSGIRNDLSFEMLAKCEAVSNVLDDADITYYFQPIVSASNGTIFGYEALMRHEGTVQLSPFDIIEGAQTLNRMYDVQKITFNCVLDQVDEKTECFEGKKIFINSLPAYRLRGSDRTQIIEKLENHRGQIVVEYTESSEFTDEELRHQQDDNTFLEIEVALDDYGSGYSNVNNLLRYNPRYVKIDRMLISGIQSSAQKQHFVKSIISYSRENNILSLAEGVETEEELNCVISLGVDLIQGYFTGYPAKEPVAAIDEHVADRIRIINLNSDNLFHRL